MLIKPEEGIVESIEATTLEGAPAFEVSVRIDADGRLERAALRADLVPEGLAAGDRVSLTRAALYRRWTLTRAG